MAEQGTLNINAAEERVAAIVIDNLYGTRHVEFKPGTLSLIRGKNSSGKSSILNAILYCLEGGKDPTVLRRGAKKGSLLITLTSGATIEMTVTDKTTDRKIFDPEGRAVPRPAECIQSLFTAFDPIHIALADNAEMAKILTTVCPITFTAVAIAKALRTPLARETVSKLGLPSEMNLDAFAKVRQSVYDARTGVNTLKRRAEQVEADIKSSLPKDNLNREELEKHVAHHEATRRECERRLQDELKETGDELTRTIRAIDDEAEKKRQAARDAAQERAEAARKVAAPEIAGLDAAIGEGRARMEEATRSAVLRERLAKANQEVRDGSLEYEALSRTLEDLDEMKVGGLKNLPIPDLLVDEDGVVKYRGLKWTTENPNTGEKVLIAFSLAAKLQAGRIPFFLCDHLANFLDAESMDVLRGALKEKGYQCIGIEVDEGDLRIEVVE